MHWLDFSVPFSEFTFVFNYQTTMASSEVSESSILFSSSSSSYQLRFLTFLFRSYRLLLKNSRKLKSRSRTHFFWWLTTDPISFTFHILQILFGLYWNHMDLSFSSSVNSIFVQLLLFSVLSSSFSVDFRFLQLS